MIDPFAIALLPAQSGGSLWTSAALWLVAALIAATLIFGAINRRREKLTTTLREYVDENQPDPMDED